MKYKGAISDTELARPSSLSFDDFYKRSILRFIENGWCDYLGIID